MKVLHLNTHDITGGATRAVNRLREGLERLDGVDSRMLVRLRTGQDPKVAELGWRDPLLRRVGRCWRRRRIEADLARYAQRDVFDAFSDDRAATGPDVTAAVRDCDLVHLHWVSNMVDVGHLLRHLPAGMPVVWTMHDMNPFTGGCHYTGGCGRFATGCGGCPQLGSKQARDLSATIWRRKRDAIAGRAPERTHFVAASQWTAGEAGRSGILDGYPVTMIPYGLDTHVFAPREAGFSRRLLGLPDSARIILFAADLLSNRRKGLAELVEGLASLPGRPNSWLLVSLGAGAPDLSASGVEHLHLGKIDDDRLLSAAYSAADVFVMPSLQEAFGQTTLEAMACAVPVVGFDNGGTPDLVRPGQTGLLAPTGDGRAMAAAIAELLGDEARRRSLGQQARQVAVSEYDLLIQAGRYRELYAALLGREKTSDSLHDRRAA
ncbi:MAG: glycosyltransferase family 4 protein [Phycisphaeraceae bacterium]